VTVVSPFVAVGEPQDAAFSLVGSRVEVCGIALLLRPVPTPSIEMACFHIREREIFWASAVSHWVSRKWLGPITATNVSVIK
jgi:hypothetical protein